MYPGQAGVSGVTTVRSHEGGVDVGTGQNLTVITKLMSTLKPLLCPDNRSMCYWQLFKLFNFLTFLNFLTREDAAFIMSDVFTRITYLLNIIQI